MGVFALAARLIALARRPAFLKRAAPTPPPQSPRSASNTPATARPVHSRPQPRPKSMRP
jgi:hypothetical protein